MSETLQPPQPHRFSQIPLSPPIAPPFGHYRGEEDGRIPTPIPSSTGYSASRPHLQPFIGRASRLSLTFLSLPLLSLLLSISHIISSSSTAKNQAEDVRAQIMATCRGVEQGAAWVQHLPRLMAEKANEQLVDGVQATLRGLAIILEDSLTIMESVLNFMIDTYRSLLMCTIEFAVRGTLALLIGAVGVISAGITSSLNAIRTSIQSDISSANSVIQSSVNAINAVTSLVNVNLNVPQFTIPSLKGLENVTLPTTFEDSLIKLNASIPSLSEFKNLLADILDVPFEALRQDLNRTFTGLAQSFNTSALPVPGSSLSSLAVRATTTNTTLDLCSSMDMSFIDDISASLSHLANVGIGLLILCFCLMWLGLIGWEWFRWRRLNENADVVEKQLMDDVRDGRKSDGMRLVQVVEHPMIERYAGAVLGRITRDPRMQSNLRWFFSFITHGSALAVLFFGIFTFLVIQVQIDAVQEIRKHSLQSSNASITASSNDIARKLNAAFLAQSETYAVQMNVVIQGWQEDIDTTIFGPWLNTTTVVLNVTLVRFYDEIESVLNKTFGDTILASPVQTFIYCILGSKISTLSQGLTWIHDNARVNLPIIQTNALMLSNSSMKDLATPIASAAAGSGTNGNDGAIGTIFDRYIKQLDRERTTAGLFVALWALVVVVGLVIVAWNSGLDDRLTLWRISRNAPTPPSAGVPTWKEKMASRFSSANTANDEKVTYVDVPHILDVGITSAKTNKSMGPWAYAEHATRSQESFLDGQDSQQQPRSVSDLNPAKHSQHLHSAAKSLLEKPLEPSVVAPGAASQASRPPIQHAFSSGWSNRLRGAVTSLLKVPGDAGHPSQLARQASQKSERSWIGQDYSPWRADSSGRYRGSNHDVAQKAITHDNNHTHWSTVYPAFEDSRYPVVRPRTVLPPINIPVRADPCQADVPGSPDSHGFSDAGETTPLTATYNRRAPSTQEYLDSRRHPHQSNPFVTPFDD